MSWLDRLEGKISAKGTSGVGAKGAKGGLATLAPTPPAGNYGIFADRLPAVTDAQAECEDAHGPDLVRVVDGETHRLTQAEIDYETGYGRVSCLLCQHLAHHGVCRPKSTRNTNYRPLEYEPFLPWRRCDEYRAAGKPIPRSPAAAAM